MMGITKQNICIWLLAHVILILADDTEKINIWPLPESLSYGDGTLYLSNDFELQTDCSQLDESASRIIKNAFLRSIDVVRAGHIVEANTSDGMAPSLVLKGINVVVSSPSIELHYGVDESYRLEIPAQGNPIYAQLEVCYTTLLWIAFTRGVKGRIGTLPPLYDVETVYGALHGLQTFTQLCIYNISSRGIVVNLVPWTIVDRPRFAYRGLLIDTSRHYLPLPVIKKVIDSMAYAKLNVLHWHIVDSQSFPLEIPSYPKLWDGAYSTSERYTFADAAEIVSYAKQRGINILAELDVPGHAQSWGIGYPSLWPSPDCKEPLDVSNEFTFKLIDGVLSDFSKIFKYKFVHLGGDEVNTSCWLSTPHVRLWLLKNGMTSASSAYQYFVLRTQQIALSHGYEIVNWEETFNNFGNKLHPKTVIHNWLGRDVAQKAVKAGFRCIVSNAFKWYLDHVDASWQGFYSNEPLTNIIDPDQQGLVLGGEVSMWGELVDASNIEQRIWPRAAAAAERLWTPYEKLAKDPEQVRSRLSYFRCVLNQRGISAAPLSGFGTRRDGAPPEPGSCYLQ